MRMRVGCKFCGSFFLLYGGSLTHNAWCQIPSRRRKTPCWDLPGCKTSIHNSRPCWIKASHCSLVLVIQQVGYTELQRKDKALQGKDGRSKARVFLFWHLSFILILMLMAVCFIGSTSSKGFMDIYLHFFPSFIFIMCLSIGGRSSWMMERHECSFLWPSKVPSFYICIEQCHPKPTIFSVI